MSGADVGAQIKILHLASKGALTTDMDYISLKDRIEALKDCMV